MMRFAILVLFNKHWVLTYCFKPAFRPLGFIHGHSNKKKSNLEILDENEDHKNSAFLFWDFSQEKLNILISSASIYAGFF